MDDDSGQNIKNVDDEDCVYYFIDRCKYKETLFYNNSLKSRR